MQAVSNSAENMLEPENIERAVNSMGSLRNNQINETPPSSITVRRALTSVKDELAVMEGVINEEINTLTALTNSKKNITLASEFYNSNINDIEKKNDGITQKKKLNNRISKFYNNDYEFKKTMLYYLKIIYFILFSICIFSIIYKKKHKEKKVYGFLFLLIIIPYFFIRNIYKIVLNNLGHLKIDILYIILLTIICTIASGLFVVSKIVLPESGNFLNIIKKTEGTIKSNI
tara:strand:- start:3552 stop:4244 length:693 start_codon:yes stop_codon:yes gene_type:complete